MRQTLLVVIPVLVAAGLLYAYTSIPVVMWDGGFDLTVNVSSAGRQLKSVKCEAYGNRDVAEWVAKHPKHPDANWSATADPFVGEPLMIHVPVSGKDSMSRREITRTQFGYLVVVAQLDDGRIVGKVVEIPDGRFSRKLSMSLP